MRNQLYKIMIMMEEEWNRKVLWDRFGTAYFASVS